MREPQRDSWLTVNRIAYIFIVVAIFLMYDISVDGYFLQSHQKNYGNTSPAGDIVLHVGQPLELFCSINLDVAKADDFSVENLVFYKDIQPIDSSYIKRVNETTIRLHMENQQESKSIYYCFLQKNSSSVMVLINETPIFNNDLQVPFNSTSNTYIISEMISVNWVEVGIKPREVDNFSCISLNWQKLNCSWSVPKNNIRTIYSIKYSPNQRYSENMSCPTHSDEDYNFCTWTLDSVPVYLKNIEHLKIIITGRNKFGNMEQAFLFNQYEHIIMDAPKRLHLLLAETKAGSRLRWDIGELQNFPKPKCIAYPESMTTGKLS